MHTIVWQCALAAVAVLGAAAEAASAGCTSLRNVTASLVTVEGERYDQQLGGCIERIAFGGNTITEAYVRHQSVPVLGRDSVRNMVRLTSVSFWGCALDAVEAGAFRNVPRLQNVQISYCNLSEVPAGVFAAIPELALLRIHDNRIDFVEDAAFANLPALRKLYGSNNQLEYWNRGWFANSTALELLDFQSNKIRTLPRRAFEGMRKLRQLFFDFNEVATIQADAFKGLRSLDYLGLRHNRLTALDERVFPDGLSVRSFLIDANHLNYLSDGLLQKLSVRDVTMDSNPWKCSCYERILFWLDRNNSTLRTSEYCTGRNVPVCSVPATTSQNCLEFADAGVTKAYLDKLRNLEPPLSPYCARLD